MSVLLWSRWRAVAHGEATRWRAYVAGGDEDVKVGGVGDANRVVESKQFGFAAYSFEPDLDSGGGYAESSAGLFELHGFGWDERRRPSQSSVKDGSEGFPLS
jgi:hypothetical protein